jgi:hypothetical protein
MKLSMAFLVLCALSVPVWAQKRPVPPTESHYRVIGIDQILKDPKTGIKKPAHADGKLAFVVLAYSKDGQHCLVEYVSKNYADHNDFKSLAASAIDPQVMAFDKALVKREVYEPLLKAAGFKDVDFDKAKVVVP